ncbi:MAG TPA: hypothetical protein VM532_11280 [Burkholderiales bacterium]|nr:hypothetical protein [Burkholderiales bacterium]
MEDIRKRYKNLQDNNPDILNEYQRILENAQRFRQWFRERFDIDIGDAGESPEKAAPKKASGKKPALRDLNLKDGVLFCLNEETLQGMGSSRDVDPKEFLEMRKIWSAALAESTTNFRPLMSSETTTEEIKDIVKWIKQIPGSDLDADNANKYTNLLERELRHRGEELPSEEIESMVGRMHRLPEESVEQLVSKLSPREAQQFATHFNTLFVALKQTVNDSKLTGDHLLHFAGLGDLASNLIKDPNDRNIFMTTIDQWVKRPAQAIMHESLDGYYNHQTTLWKLSQSEPGQSGKKGIYLESFQFPTHKISRVSSRPSNSSGYFPTPTSTEQLQENKSGRSFKKIISGIIKPRRKSHPPPTTQQEQKAQPIPKEPFDLSFLRSAHEIGLVKCTGLMKDEIQKAGYQAPRFEVIEGSNTQEPKWVASITPLDDRGEKTEVTTKVAQQFANEVAASISKDSSSSPTFGQIGEFLTTLSLYQEKLGLKLSTLQDLAITEESNKRGAETTPPSTAVGGSAAPQTSWSWLNLDSSPDSVKRGGDSLRNVDEILQQGEISLHDDNHLEIQKVDIKGISYAVHIDMSGEQHLKISFKTQKVKDGLMLKGLPDDPVISNLNRPRLQFITRPDDSPITLQQGKIDQETHILTFSHPIKPGTIGEISGRLSAGQMEIAKLHGYVFAAPDEHSLNALALVNKDARDFREKMKETKSSRQTHDDKSQSPSTSTPRRGSR